MLGRQYIHITLSLNNVHFFPQLIGIQDKHGYSWFCTAHFVYQLPLLHHSGLSCPHLFPVPSSAGMYWGDHSVGANQPHEVVTQHHCQSHALRISNWKSWRSISDTQLHIPQRKNLWLGSVILTCKSQLYTGVL